MGCVGKLTQGYRERMCNLLHLCVRPFRLHESVVCANWISKQLLGGTLKPFSIKPRRPQRVDCELVRCYVL